MKRSKDSKASIVYGVLEKLVHFKCVLKVKNYIMPCY